MGDFYRTYYFYAMDFKELYHFLEDLQQNNAKEWMDANRKRYISVRNNYIAWLDALNTALLQEDSTYKDTPGRKAINRINNNLMFHPEKPVYKDHFGAGVDLGGPTKQGDFYIHLGVHESFIAGGFYRPQKEILDSIRDAIDYNGDDFKKIIHKPSFVKTFSSLIDDGDSLKTAPKGYSQDHEHVDLLRLKTYAVQVNLTKEMVCHPDFMQRCITVYKEMKPFRDYLNKAVTV